MYSSFCKIVDYLDPLKTNNKDIFWMKLKKKHNLPRDIYIGSIYLSDENSTASINDKTKNLSDDTVKR